MRFNNHSVLEGSHAFLSASKWRWIDQDPEKVKTNYLSALAVQMGTELHEVAAKLIKLKRKQPRTKDTFAMYVNDAIGFKMTPEQPLFYSFNCFGTADAISFKNNFLRIHDLKTGKIEAHMEQLMIYAALFCLEYDYKPESIQIELRIYQYDDIKVCNPEPEKIREIMDKIIELDKVIEEIKEDM